MTPARRDRGARGSLTGKDMAAGKVYSVGQVNAYIARMFSEDWLMRSISVRGEVSNCTYHSSGHIYFTLKDASGTLACLMFAGKRQGGLSFRMKEGDAVVIDGTIRVFEKQGRYQLYAERIVRDGVGLLNERYELLKKKLEEMGMFAEEYKKPIPRYIRRLGVVTAPTGAAVRDIIQITRRRNPFVEILLCPVLVQGEGAAPSIAAGIRALDGAGVDVIIVGRGGGSLEDLWAFNEEIVAQAVFDCSTPVISAVGHEVDTVITDYVADLRAPTPSAAAELAVFDYNQFQADLSSLEAALRLDMTRRLRRLRQQTEILRRDLIRQSPAMRLETQRMAAEQLNRRLQHAMQLKLARCRSELALEDRFRVSLERRIMQWRARLELTSRYESAMERALTRWRFRLDLKTRYDAAMERRLRESRHKLQLLSAGLEKNSPLSKLSGGYGYVSDRNGRNLTSVSDVRPGDEIHIRMRDGRIRAGVLEIQKMD